MNSVRGALPLVRRTLAWQLPHVRHASCAAVGTVAHGAENGMSMKWLVLWKLAYRHSS